MTDDVLQNDVDVLINCFTCEGPHTFYVISTVDIANCPRNNTPSIDARVNAYQGAVLW